MLKVLKWLFSSLLLTVLVMGIFAAFAPASLIPQVISFAEQEGMIPPDSPRLYFSQLSGTVWEGEAKQAVLDLNDNEVDLGQFSWSVDIVKLIERKLAVSILTNASDQKLNADVSFLETGEVEVTNAEGYFPIKTLEPWVPLLIQGKLAFVVDHWVFTSRELISIDGVLNLEYADWLGGDTDMPLGSYMAQVSMEQENLKIQIDDFSATLGVEGLITVMPSSNYHFKATLQPREGLAPEVAESILWFGKRAYNGDILIDRRGKL